MKIVVATRLKDGVRVFDLSIHDDPGGTGDVIEVGEEPEIRAKLHGIGLTADEVEDAIWMLNENEFLALDVRIVRALRDQPRSQPFPREDRQT